MTAGAAADTSILDLLDAELGPGVVSRDDDLRARHRDDWSGLATALPLAVARPRTVAEVSRFLALCHAHRQPVAVQGGLTGLCGSAGTLAGEIALSLARLDAVEHVGGGAMVVEAGVTVAAAQEAARAAGAELGIDFGARGSATIGGAISTNAGGLHVIETGMTRAQVLGLEVVLADGRVLSELTAMVKVNSGFDLKQIFIGAEGALGVVTRACLALRPHRAGLATALLSLGDPATVPTALDAARTAFGPDLSAFEAMWPDYVTTMSARTPFALPLAGPLLVILETRAATSEAAMARMEDFLEASVEAGFLVDAVVAQSQAQAEALWKLRDEGPAMYGQIFTDTVPFDVSVPLAALVDASEAIAAPYRDAPDLYPLSYGHIGDQNLHFVLGADRPLGAAEKSAVQAHVYDTVIAHGGAISAEHGIGFLKKPYLQRARSDVAIALMKDLKRAFDPHNILSRGRVFDLAPD